MVKIPVGVRTVLWGTHAFWCHPFFIALAWCRLYGVPMDARIWIAFFVHDLGYAMFGCPNIDGPEGEKHPEWGARFMSMFDGPGSTKWHDFVLFHSRAYAKRAGRPFNRLCVADKYAIAITPAFIYMPLAKLSGEIKEYRALLQDTSSKYNDQRHDVYQAGDSDWEWHAKLRLFMHKWVKENKNGAEKGC